MAKPTSSVAIGRLALDLLNASGIENIEAPTSKIEILIARWYDVTRGKLLESANWVFAQHSEAIPRGGTPTIARYSDYYVFPNNYLKLTAIKDWDYPLQRWDYRIEGKSLLMNNAGAASLDTFFIQDFEDVTAFPGYFSNLLAAELALSVAMKLTSKPSMLTFISEYITDLRRVAYGANGQVQPPRRYELSKIKQVGINPASQNQVAGPHNFLFDPN
ncbi:MAG: hypothetical protein JRJ45_00035 [Deltaproteobacteria bacterium]|nr:hypothetical protein [Deltaproteobacteria bacterium]